MTCQNRRTLKGLLRTVSGLFPFLVCGTAGSLLNVFPTIVASSRLSSVCAASLTRFYCSTSRFFLLKTLKSFLLLEHTPNIACLCGHASVTHLSRLYPVCRLFVCRTFWWIVGKHYLLAPAYRLYAHTRIIWKFISVFSGGLHVWLCFSRRLLLDGSLRWFSLQTFHHFFDVEYRSSSTVNCFVNTVRVLACADCFSAQGLLLLCKLTLYKAHHPRRLQMYVAVLSR